METFLIFLNNNTNVFSLIFSFLVMISTIVYAILTCILVNETRKMREIQTEPRIQIILEYIEPYINEKRLNIKNIGQGPAYNIIFKPIVVSGGKNAEDILNKFLSVKAFSSGLNYLGPSQYFYTDYYKVVELFKKNELFNIVMDIELQYKSITNKEYKEKITIDFKELEGTYQLGKPSLFSIAKSLENIEKYMKNIASGFKMDNTDISNS